MALEHVKGKYPNPIIMSVFSKEQCSGSDTDGNTPLHVCCVRNFFPGIEVLVAKDVNLNYQNKEGMTPLHCLFLDTTVGIDQVMYTFQFLTQKGADPRIKDKDGLTPLDYCPIGYRKILQHIMK